MRYGWLIGLLGLLTISSLFIGVSTIQVIDLLQFKGQSTQLFLATRLPRTVCLILAGATSSICGLIMQHLTQTLPQKNQLMLPLIGVMLGNIIGSIATFFAYQFQLIQNMSSWLQGNFATIIRGNYELLYVTVPLLIVISFFAYRFTIVGLGESFAVNLGIDYKKMQLLGIGLVSLASAIVLIMVGSIPFLGVIIPNITARLYGDQVHKTIGITALLGSVFLLFCDIVARLVIYPYEIPVSVIVGIFGAIIFLYLLVRRKKYA
ncbi:iron chelate uptake ABC transporter family permease subunit [Enterococcus hirae]|uniref:iron chelate uptake ABC transporter family permease subunit n=1 Tax=Enterococcus hirae TaxID=1354 RepID=UPI002952E1B4|nr:iron chelate uptake ABC transporter family permease subunit [Enterococcus hirae]MDV7770757.1 iron chelate uptake ABC transporter family permease subunit [Enterococcus hirae]